MPDLSYPTVRVQMESGLEGGAKSSTTPQIIDLRTNEAHDGHCELALRQEIIQGLTKQEALVPGCGPDDRLFTYRKTIPTVVLYDDYGLQLYDKITTIKEYYLLARPT